MKNLLFIIALTGLTSVTVHGQRLIRLRDTVLVNKAEFLFSKNYPKQLPLGGIRIIQNPRFVYLQLTAPVTNGDLRELGLKGYSKRVTGNSQSVKLNNTSSAVWLEQTQALTPQATITQLKRMLGSKLQWAYFSYTAFDMNDLGSHFVPDPRELIIRNDLFDRPDVTAELADFGLLPTNTEFTGYRLYRLADTVSFNVFPVAEYLMGEFPNEQRLFFYNHIPLINPTQSGGGPADPLWRKQSKPFELIKLPRAWEMAQSAPPAPKIKVAVIDEGFHLNSPDLEFTGGGLLTNLSLPALPTLSPHHGTQVAHILAAKHNNVGIAGTFGNIQIIPYALVNNRAGEVATGIRQAGIENAQIISLSVMSQSWLGSNLEIEIQAALDRGAIIVAATGNDSRRDGFGLPAAYPGVLAVSGTHDQEFFNASNGGYFQYSNQDRGVSVSAPACVLSVKANGHDAYFIGTSASTPMVAGLIAMVWSKFPILTATQVKNAIERSADQLPGYPFQNHPGFANGPHNPLLGYGRINAEKAMQTARAYAVPAGN